MKTIRFLAGILDRLTDLLAYVGGATIPILVLIVTYEVVMRYFLGRGTTWVSEVSSYLLFYLALLGAAWVLKQEGHARIDTVTNLLSPRKQALTNRALSFISVFICLVLFIVSLLHTWEVFQTGEVEYHVALKYPKWLLLIPLPIGAFLLAIQFLRRAWRRTGLFT